MKKCLSKYLTSCRCLNTYHLRMSYNTRVTKHNVIKRIDAVLGRFNDEYYNKINSQIEILLLAIRSLLKILTVHKSPIINSMIKKVFVHLPKTLKVLNSLFFPWIQCMMYLLR